MKALVTIESKFYRTPEGHYYPRSAPLNYNFFSRYLDVFDEIIIVSRTSNIVVPPPATKRTDGPGISILDIPMFSNPFNLLILYPKIRSIMNQAIPSCQAFFLRVPGIVGTIAWKEINRLGLPFAVEVVGNPSDKSGNDKFPNPLYSMLRLFLSQSLRVQCLKACAAAYVTKYSIQKKFPPGKGNFTTNFSNLDLPAAFFAKEARRYVNPASKLVFVGTLEISYKGQEFLLQAMSLLKTQGFHFQLTMVGDGKLRPFLEETTKSLGIAENVTFLGHVAAGAGVAAVLDHADIFILPSLTEGLPRSMIEAMSQGLPCIGTNIGGIPELLPPADLVPPKDPEALANKIIEISRDVKRLNRTSARNLTAAQEYQYEELRKRRIAFYNYVQHYSKHFYNNQKS